MQILIIEDDAALGVFLQKGLGIEGHQARLTADAQTGLDLACEMAYDLIVLDLGVSEQNGIELLEGLRRERVDTAILVLTTRNSPAERVRYLDVGADDVLMKPLSFSELTARCRALMRRHQRSADPVLRHGDLELDRLQRKVARNGRQVELTVKEFALLEYLMMARGRVCSRSELLEEVWQMSPDAGTNVVDVYVNYLRKKLSFARALNRDLQGLGTGAADSLISTVRGSGYAIDLGSQRKPVRSVTAVPAPQGIFGFERMPKADSFLQTGLARA